MNVLKNNVSVFLFITFYKLSGKTFQLVTVFPSLAPSSVILIKENTLIKMNMCNIHTHTHTYVYTYIISLKQDFAG